MPDFIIRKRSHHFVVRELSDRGKRAVENFARRFIQWGLVRQGRRSIKAPLKVFAAATKDRSEYRFHINCYKDFIDSVKLDNVHLDAVPIFDDTPPVGDDVDMPIYPNWAPRDYQEPIIDYLVAPPPPRAKMLALYTGGGKTFSAMWSVAKLQSRLVMISKPTYLENWALDAKETYAVPSDEIVIIKGSGPLMRLIALARADRESLPKVILISNKTIQNWITAYEKFGPQGSMDIGYDCVPDELFEILGAKVKVCDELHQDFHLNFKIDLYTNIQTTIGLTATLISDDPFITRMHELAYPSRDRYKSPPYVPHISSIALMYQLKNPSLMRWTSMTGSYSHVIFEQTLGTKRNEASYWKYLSMIEASVKQYYETPTRKDGDRCIIFCSTKEMCGEVTKYLRGKFPQYTIERYVDEDPYDNLMEPDIRVTTLQSAGTAVDIPQLTTAILTVAVNSSVSNIQGFGRLRPLKDGRTPIFVYFVCTDVPKHIEYHERKKDIIRTRSVGFMEVNYGSLI